MTLKEKVIGCKNSGLTLNQIMNKYHKEKKATIKAYFYAYKPSDANNLVWPHFDLEKLKSDMKNEVTSKKTSTQLIQDIWQSELQEQQKEQLVITISKWM